MHKHTHIHTTHRLKKTKKNNFFLETWDTKSRPVNDFAKTNHCDRQWKDKENASRRHIRSWNRIQAIATIRKREFLVFFSTQHRHGERWIEIHWFCIRYFHKWLKFLRQTLWRLIFVSFSLFPFLTSHEVWLWHDTSVCYFFPLTCGVRGVPWSCCCCCEKCMQMKNDDKILISFPEFVRIFVSFRKRWTANMRRPKYVVFLFTCRLQQQLTQVLWLFVKYCKLNYCRYFVLAMCAGTGQWTLNNCHSEHIIFQAFNGRHVFLLYVIRNLYESEECVEWILWFSLNFATI